MGVVYRGRYVVKDIDVAVKMLPEDVTNPIVLARFEREMEVLKTLKHPNIVRSFGGVCEDKQRFYAMELMSGGSLEDQLQQRGRLPWETVIQYGLQMCAALEYLHLNGVIHRDLKPANFLLDEQGQLKLSDFGLASVIAARKITSAGKTAGTLLYMAPEQIRGGDITPQTDLYALGCVLFELLTGKPPYIGDTPAATMHLHCQAEIPRITPIALDCPIALEQLVTKLLQKEPAKRPVDAKAVARELGLVTSKVSVVTKTRAIDGESLRRSPKSPAELQYKQTRDLSRDGSGRALRWPLLVSLMLVLVLSAWVVQLRQSAKLAQRSEELWVQAVATGQPPVRIFALRSLGQLPNLSDESLAAVVDVLNSPSEMPEIRAVAATALGQMGARARSYAPVLHRHWTQDPQDEVRTSAYAALQRIQAETGSSGWGWLTLVGAMSVLGAIGFVLWRHYGHPLVHESRTPHGSDAG